MWHDEQDVSVSAGYPLDPYGTDAGSLTVTDFPVIADVDADGEAEIVVGLSSVPIGQRSSTDAHGLRVYGHREHGWPGARPIWNQHAFTGDDVRDDGTFRSDTVGENTFRVTQALAREGVGRCIDW